MRKLAVALFFVFVGSDFSRTYTAEPLPAITAPVNDVAKVIDPASAAEMDRMIRALQEKTGDVVVENEGRGIGEKGKDNGLLILLALKERRVQIEVGYGLEGFITDGFSGETSREVMAPEFRNGRYGPGLLAGTERLVGHCLDLAAKQHPADRQADLVTDRTRYHLVVAGKDLHGDAGPVRKSCPGRA